MLPQLSRARLVAVTVGLLLSNLLWALDSSIVATAMPRIIAELSGLEYYAWVTTAFLVGAVTMIPISGKLGDLFGRKRFVLGGMVGFVVASALCGASQNMPELVLFRCIQGIFGGVLNSSVFSSMADLYPPATRARVQGIFVSVPALAAIAGPTFGGYLSDGVGWRWIFYVNVPLGCLAAIVVALTMPRIRAEGTRADIDVGGAVLLAGGLVPLLGALSVIRDHGWTSPLVLALLIVAGGMLATFAWVESGQPHPIVPFELFGTRTFAVAAAVAFLGAFGMFGSNIFIPLIFQGVLGLSATNSGQLLTPMLLAMVVSALVSGQLITRIQRYRYVGAAGLAAVVTGLFLLSRVTSGSGQLEVVRDIVIMGLGYGMTMPIYQNAVLSAVPRAFVGVASSQLQFWNRMGQTVGVAVLGSVLARRLPEALAAEGGAFRAGQGDARLTTTSVNPDTLLEPGRIAALRAQLPAELLPSFDQLLGLLRQALAQSLSDAFLLASVVVGVGILVSLFLHEVPFRRDHVSGAQVQTRADSFAD